MALAEIDSLPAKTDLRTLATTIKARWVCEQAHQQMKEELGLRASGHPCRINRPDT
jgi:hypothetical protein